MTKTITATLKEAGALLEKREYTNAESLYRKAMQLQPGNAAAAMGIAMIHNRTGQPEEALKILQKVWKAISGSKTKKNHRPQSSRSCPDRFGPTANRPGDRSPAKLSRSQRIKALDRTFQAHSESGKCR